jgi:hypothetical protein
MVSVRLGFKASVGLAATLLALAAWPAVAGADHDTYGSGTLGSGSGLGLSADLSTGLGILAPPSPLALGSSTGVATTGDGAALGAADDTTGDFHSANFHKLGRTPIAMGGGQFASGSDLAFKGNLLIAGAYEGVGLFRIRSTGALEQLSFYNCPGSQGDVTVLGSTMFVSIDSPSSNSGRSATCNNTKTNLDRNSRGREGLRIVDISSPAAPRQIGFVETECGSHTQTLIPRDRISYIYVASYPLTPEDSCTEVNHPEGEISVVKVPNSSPATADVAAVRDVLPPTVTPETIGCHDIGVMPNRNLAVASCLGAWAVLDISNPVSPVTRGVIQNPAIELDHSAQLTWDGKYAVIGDEHAGAAGGGGCSPSQASPVGAMWFYNITDRQHPVLEGSYSLPRVPPIDSAEEVERFRCTTHNYMVLPMRDPNRYVAVSPYYSGGLSAVDFTDPANPREIGYYLPQVEGANPDIWSGYWYRGRIYTNEHASQLGLGVYSIDGLGKTQVADLGTVVNPQTQVLP